jgi:hypothetical protein
MSATTFLSRIFLSLIFFVSNEHKWKEEEEEEEDKQGEVEEDNDEEDEGDEVELLLACNNTSARFIANSSDLHKHSPHHFLLQTQEVESVAVEVFPEFCLFDRLLSSSFFVFFFSLFLLDCAFCFAPCFFRLRRLRLCRSIVCVCVCVCVFSCFFFSFFCTQVEAAFYRSCSGEASGWFQRSESGLERSFDEHGVEATFLRFFVRVAMASELPAQLTGIETEVQNIFKSLSYVVILPLSLCL